MSKASKFEQLVTNIISANYQPSLEKLKEDIKTKGDNVCRSTTQKWQSVQGVSDPIPQILNDPIHFNWKVKEKLLKTLCEERIVEITTWKDIEYIFKLRNDFAHNPIHLRDGVLVLTTTKGEQTFTEDSIDLIRDALTRIENDLQRILSDGSGSEVIPMIVEELEEEFSLV